MVVQAENKVALNIQVGYRESDREESKKVRATVSGIVEEIDIDKKLLKVNLQGALVNLKITLDTEINGEENISRLLDIKAGESITAVINGLGEAISIKVDK